MKNQNEQEVNIIIVDEVSKDKKLIKSLLKIPYNDFKEPKALRVFASEDNAVYASSRLGNLVRVDEGYEVDVTGNNLIGKRYELSEQGTGKILLKGKVVTKKSEANVVELNSRVANGK